MNLQPLFTTTRVVTTLYRLASTTLLLFYLAKRVADGREFSRDGGRSSDRDDHSWDRRGRIQ